MTLMGVMKDYNRKNREFTKFVKTATIEEIAEHLKKDDDDRLLAAYLVKKLRDPKSKASKRPAANAPNLLGYMTINQKKAGKP